MKTVQRLDHRHVDRTFVELRLAESPAAGNALRVTSSVPIAFIAESAGRKWALDPDPSLQETQPGKEVWWARDIAAVKSLIVLVDFKGPASTGDVTLEELTTDQKFAEDFERMRQGS